MQMVGTKTGGMKGLALRKCGMTGFKTEGGLWRERVKERGGAHRDEQACMHAQEWGLGCTRSCEVWTGEIAETHLEQKLRP